MELGPSNCATHLQGGAQPPTTPAGAHRAPHGAPNGAGPLALPSHMRTAPTPGMPPTPATPQDLSIGEAVHRRKRAHPSDADHAPPPVYLSHNHIRTRERGAVAPRTPAQKRIRTQVWCA